MIHELVKAVHDAKELYDDNEYVTRISTHKESVLICVKRDTPQSEIDKLKKPINGVDVAIGKSHS